MTSKSQSEMPGVDQIRGQFPALAQQVVFLENAGGSQVPACVAEAICHYLKKTYVQLGAGYPLSDRCTQNVENAHAFAQILAGAGDGKAILGSSTTALLNMLAGCVGKILEPGQEIILAETGHEANLGCWKRLEAHGAVIRWWRMDPLTFALPLEGLENLLTTNTAVVALPHVSNLLGGITDLHAVVGAAHAAGAKVVADGVAYAPHRAVDVAAWDVDFYAWSTYKVYGPHMAVLFAKTEALAELPGPNHFFVGRDEGAYHFEPGGANHESCAGLLALGDYLKFLAAEPPGDGCSRQVVEKAFGRMAQLEQPLIERLIGYLTEHPRVKLVGPPADADRVGTVSFVHEQKSSQEIAAAVNATGLAIRHGHMYAYHLCEAAGLKPDDGVVRVSFVHYNTLAEIEKLIGVLDRIL